MKAKYRASRLHFDQVFQKPEFKNKINKAGQSLKRTAPLVIFWGEPYFCFALSRAIITTAMFFPKFQAVRIPSSSLETLPLSIPKAIFQ